MKNIIALVIASVMVCGLCYAAVTTGTFGDQNSSKAYRMSVDTDGVVSIASDTTIYLNSGYQGGYALCLKDGFIGHCTSTPTNGACTCTKN